MNEHGAGFVVAVFALVAALMLSVACFRALWRRLRRPTPKKDRILVDREGLAYLPDGEVILRGKRK